MVAPVVAAAGVSAIGSLLGGIFGKSKAQKPVYVVPEYQQIRDKAEAAGFNPLTALTSAPGSVGNYSYQPNTMGEAIANAAMHLADGLDPEKAARVEQLEIQNAQLRKDLDAATLRPRGPGLYAGRVSYGPLPGQGGQNAGLPVGHGLARSDGAGSLDGPVGGGASGLRPFPQAYPVDPRRAADNKPQGSTSGFMTIDNPYLPGPIHVPTMDGDEAVQWYDLPSLAIYAGANAAASVGVKLRDAQNWAFAKTMPGAFRSNGKVYALQPPKGAKPQNPKPKYTQVPASSRGARY